MPSQAVGSHCGCSRFSRRFLPLPIKLTPLLLTWLLALVTGLFLGRPALAQEGGAHGGHSEAELVMPSFATEQFLGVPGNVLLGVLLLVPVLGVVFGLLVYSQLRNLPVHTSMLEVSELIYATCRTYLETQIRFILILWAFIGTVMLLYFGVLQGYFAQGKILQLGLILFFSGVGIAGSCAVAWFGIRVNTFANSRTAFAALRGKPFPCYAIPLKAGMSIGMLLISIELIIMLLIILVIPGSFAGSCFIGFAIGESLGASALRIAGGIFTKIADIGSDLMKIVFGIKEDDARNPGVIADCTGDNAGDSVGPSADGFETYGVTGVALISFILLAVQDPAIQIQLLVWIFVMRIVMVIASWIAYTINEGIAKNKYEQAEEFNFEHPLTFLVWLTSIISIVFTFLISALMIPRLGDDPNLWWQLSLIITCGTLAGAVIPELIKVFTSTESAHVREVVISSQQGGASLNILSGFIAGNYSSFWMGIILIFLMGVAAMVSGLGLGKLMTVGEVDASPVFAFGLVAFGFLGMGPVTIAVDSYGPVTDNAQSVYELSVIEQMPGIQAELKRDHGFDVNFEQAKHHLEANDGAGNTFKATAKPVLIGTAVVGATTMIFSIIVMLTGGLADAEKIRNLSLLHPPFLLGMIAGGSMIYWFTGASAQAVTTGAYRAVEFIKANIRLDDGAEKASIEDSKKVVGICTQYAQKGMFNIFLAVFFGTLAFACVESFFFIGYLISIALFGLFQALFMANAGGAWDNAKKIVEVELKQKGTPLHDATVVGDTVGDPFKDTSSVALNPVIKFTTLFGLLAVEVAEKAGALELPIPIRPIAALIFFGLTLYYVWCSFYKMRIGAVEQETPVAVAGHH
ncbi:MAG: sodium-translocating pyrophosphatase [Armatimonadetes bacterium]|nr:sodium-translocating pyrophosphatase [Armatimonadota bacterium]